MGGAKGIVEKSLIRARVFLTIFVKVLKIEFEIFRTGEILD